MQANDARCTPHDPRRWKTSCPELAEVAGTYTQFPGMCSNPSDPPKKLSFWVQLLGTFYSWKKPITVAALGISLEDRIPDSQQIVGVSSQCIDYCYQPNSVGAGTGSGTGTGVR